MINSIPAIVNDVTIYGNLASVLAHIPFADYWDYVAKYEQSLAKYQATVGMPLSFDRLEKRMANLEARQTLTEADLALLLGQLNRVNIPSR